MNKKIFDLTIFIIFLLSFLIGTFFLFFPYNKYLINEDTRQILFWVPQFHNKELFQNDILAIYSKNEEGWGYILLYYFFSFFFEPLFATKFLAIFIFIFRSLYTFKLTEKITNKYFGLLAAFIYMRANPPTAALPRDFGLLFLMMFFYYLIEKKYYRSAIFLILNSLFYPITFLVGFATYLISYLPKGKKNIVRIACPKNYALLLILLFSGVVLSLKYFLFYSPALGKPVAKKQIMQELPAYTVGSREYTVPTMGLTRTIINNIAYGGLFTFNYDKILPLSLKTIDPKIVFIIIFSMLIVWQRKLKFPPEVIYLFFSSIILFKLADLILLKIYLPRRYIERSFFIVNLVIFYSLLNYIIKIINNFKNHIFAKNNLISKVNLLKLIPFMGTLIIFMNFLHNFSFIRKTSFSDFSNHKELYAFIASLPKDSLLAGPPKLMDSIPLFSQRKVFLMYELSYAIYDNYWQTIKKRTYNFYDAYYSESPLTIAKFCQDNEINFLVIDKNHFESKYLEEGRFYIKPFNPYIVKITGNKNNFFLTNIPDTKKLFEKDNIFVISCNIVYQ